MNGSSPSRKQTVFIIAVVVVIIVFTGIVFVILALSNLSNTWQTVEVPQQPTITPALLEPTPTTSDRVTVLVLGSDTSPEEPSATDTLILVTIDRKTGTGGILSIPYDLYMDIPGYGLDRVANAYPLGGGQLAIDTLESGLGISIDHYLLICLEAFPTLVDEIGGIDIYVTQEIDDQTYPATCAEGVDCGYDPFYLSIGNHHMDGEMATKYARTDYGSSDDRAHRQHDVLYAFRDRISNLDVLPTLIQNAPDLYNALGDSIRTDMTLEEMRELVALYDASSDNIRSDIIDQDYLSSYTTEDDQVVSVINSDQVQDLIDYVFWVEADQ